jgi:hypothetical protein
MMQPRLGWLLAAPVKGKSIAYLHSSQLLYKGGEVEPLRAFSTSPRRA